jgi:virginiamycin A acetyltransferase
MLISRGKFKTFLLWLFYRKLYKNDIRINPFVSYLGKNTIIKRGTNINGKCFLDSTKEVRITIGKYCAIAENFRIRPRNHNINYPNIQDKLQHRYSFQDLTVIKGDVEIGNACWIGDNVTILSGVKIGNGVVIAAGAVVTKSIPNYAVVAGVPAKVIKYRFDESSRIILDNIDWWNWNEDKIKKNHIFFNSDLTKISFSDIKIL